MSKLLMSTAALAVLFGVSVPAQAQQFKTESAVLEICSEVALAALDGDVSSLLRGQCIEATGLYLQDVSNRGLSEGEFDQVLANLVVVLADILFNPNCVIESEVAQAIALANASANDPEQQAQIQLIFETVNTCDFLVTAAIFSPDPESLSSDSDSNTANRSGTGSPSLPLASSN